MFGITGKFDNKILFLLQVRPQRCHFFIISDGWVTLHDNTKFLIP